MLKWRQMAETKPMGLGLADERALEWTASPTYMLTGTWIVSSPSLVPLMLEKHGITCSNRDDGDSRFTHQHADVHGQVDLASSAVVVSCPKAGQDALGFANVACSVVCMDIFHTYIKKDTQSIQLYETSFKQICVK